MRESSQHKVHCHEASSQLFILPLFEPFNLLLGSPQLIPLWLGDVYAKSFVWIIFGKRSQIIKVQVTNFTLNMQVFQFALGAIAHGFKNVSHQYFDITQIILLNDILEFVILVSHLHIQRLSYWLMLGTNLFGSGRRWKKFNFWVKFKYCIFSCSPSFVFYSVCLSSILSCVFER